jgi:DNA-binding NarL/FixJ family response regulator
MIRILVVHKVRLTCELIAGALRSEADIQVVAMAQNGEEALAKLDQHGIDVALVHINLPETGAVRFTRAAAQSHKRVKILMMGVVPSRVAVLRCIEEGAVGYVLEDDALGEFVRKIRRVYGNEFLVSSDIGGALLARLAELKRQITVLRSNSRTEKDATPGEYPGELTHREQEILALLAQNLSNREIADWLVIELGTVKNHVHNILRKLDVRSRRHAVIFARQLPVRAPATRIATLRH